MPPSACPSPTPSPDNSLESCDDGNGSSLPRTQSQTRPTLSRTVMEFDGEKKSIIAALQDCTRRGSNGSSSGSPGGSFRERDQVNDDDNGDNKSASSASSELVANGDCEKESSKSDGVGGDDVDAQDAPEGGRGAFSGLTSADTENKDWLTPNLDPETSRPQTIEEETDRLLVLRSYSILDADPEESFERITGLASRIFRVPVSLVSLVDLGRQFFVSKHGLRGHRGLTDVRETPRVASFASHCVQSIQDVLIVPDASLDPRFEANPWVTGPPYVRFYAGAPLVCPESGHRLGTLDIVDTKPHPQGLTLGEKQNLRELAALVMETLVQRKNVEVSRRAEEKSRAIAESAASPSASTQENGGDGNGEFVVDITAMKPPPPTPAGKVASTTSKLQGSVKGGTAGQQGLAGGKKSQQSLKMLSLHNASEYDSQMVYDVINKTIEDDGKVPAQAEAVAKAVGVAGKGAESPSPVATATHAGGSESAKEKPSKSASGNRQKRALVIDDSVVIRKSIGRALAKMGFDVTQATNGFEGLKLLQSCQYDVVLCDFLMPVMDGPDCVEQYRSWESDHRPSNIRQHIIGLSSHDSEDAVQRGLDAGMNDFIPKTASLKKILDKAISICNMPDEQAQDGDGDGSGSSRRLAQRRFSPGHGLSPSSPSNLPLSSLAMHRAFSSSMTGAKQAAAGTSFRLANLRGPGGMGDLSGSKMPTSNRRLSGAFSATTTAVAEDAPECLIVEDSMTALKVLMKAVEGKGWRARVVHEGAEGLRLLKSKRWDAVLVGELLPDQSGIECVEQFRGWEEARGATAAAPAAGARQNNIYLICAPGGSNDSEPPKGFDGKLGKPVDRTQVEELLGKTKK